MTDDLVDSFYHLFDLFSDRTQNCEINEIETTHLARQIFLSQTESLFLRFLLQLVISSDATAHAEEDVAFITTIYNRCAP
jgi:hypothetical protein